MEKINPLSKFRSPLISFIGSKDTISVPGITCSTIWGSLLVLQSFAVQFGDHLRARTHRILRDTNFKHEKVGFVKVGYSIFANLCLAAVKKLGS